MRFGIIQGALRCAEESEQLADELRDDRLVDSDESRWEEEGGAVV